MIVHTNVQPIGERETLSLLSRIAQCYNGSMKPKTIENLFNKVVKKYWDSPRFKESGHLREVLSKYKNHIGPEFGQVKIGKVTRLQVMEWHEKMSSTPVTANRSLEVLSKCYKYAIDREWFDGPNPCATVKAFTERKRTRFATDEELAKLGKILDREKVARPVEVTFLYTLFLTGARPRSLERAKWQNFINGELVFDGKSTHRTGEREVLIIPSFVLEMIKALPKREDDLIFGIKIPTHFWQKIREEAGCIDLWARDSRRTYATIGMSNNVDMPIISKLLNHKSVQTTDRYALLNNKARVQASDTIADKVHTILKGTKAVNE